MSTCCTLYVTARSAEEGHVIATTLLAERLIACANVIPGVISHYRWEGTTERGVEIAMMMKTRTALVARVTARIKELHSYDCPCIVAWPIEGGNADYLAWIVAETDGGD